MSEEVGHTIPFIETSAKHNDNVTALFAGPNHTLKASSFMALLDVISMNAGIANLVLQQHFQAKHQRDNPPEEKSTRCAVA